MIFFYFLFFRYDLVDISRQSLQLIFDGLYEKLIASYKAANITEFDHNSQLLLSVFDQMESILASDEHFLLGKWIGAAKLLSSTDQVCIRIS